MSEPGMSMFANTADFHRELMLVALRRVLAASNGQCENYTTGIGSCFSYGRDPDAQYTADRCCSPCLAHAALETVGSVV